MPVHNRFFRSPIPFSCIAYLRLLNHILSSPVSDLISLTDSTNFYVHRVDREASAFIMKEFSVYVSLEHIYESLQSLPLISQTEKPEEQASTSLSSTVSKQ